MQDKGEAGMENCGQGLELFGSGISKPLPRAVPYRPTLSFILGLSQLPSQLPSHGGARQEAEMELGSLCSSSTRGACAAERTPQFDHHLVPVVDVTWLSPHWNWGSGNSRKMGRVSQNYRITECSGLEGTHSDH